MADVGVQAKKWILIALIGTVLLWGVRIALDMLIGMAKLALVLLVAYLLFLAANGHPLNWDQVQQVLTKGWEYLMEIGRSLIEKIQQ